jgi:hypothetical protein
MGRFLVAKQVKQMFNIQRPDDGEVDDLSSLKFQVFSESRKFDNMQIVMKLTKVFSWK